MNVNPSFKKPRYDCHYLSTAQNTRQTLTENFMINPPIFDLTPPQPNSFPKAFHYSLDHTRHYSHKFTSMFLANCKPLLVNCEVGLPVQQLIMFSNQYNNNKSQGESVIQAEDSIKRDSDEQQLELEDQMLINQIVLSEQQIQNLKEKIQQEKIKDCKDIQAKGNIIEQQNP